MAQKASFGARLCLVSIRGVKIENKGGQNLQNLAQYREIQAKTKLSENTLKLCYLAEYTNGCNETLNLTQIETKKCVH